MLYLEAFDLHWNIAAISDTPSEFFLQLSCLLSVQYGPYYIYKGAAVFVILSGLYTGGVIEDNWMGMPITELD